ncbi:Hypothetical predicted protein [Pelobates cultripes]|uniref:Uncharacterized protein n=1 Tax=Pelobates cultripes TaxID=61616 RepID=A0AAD1RA04_PELCU|nr:Hypothetical predicted protein [Pelobates cultripes]
MDAPDPIPKAEQPAPHLQLEDRGAPVNKDLMVNIRAFFWTDLEVAQVEVIAITEDISSLSQCLAGTAEQVQHLQTSHMAMHVMDTH